ncbi:hypothetical protein WG66_002505 [Moniliophthora roreri]|uniref:Uncharacterized protein n=1 Tax=Moniliophthora roreri TaxID=221103 RepID=A0A0W0G6G6_MONRR|nr:hypothetical protein WG66_002505 [Moniliophthora roreri]
MASSNSQLAEASNHHDAEKGAGLVEHHEHTGSTIQLTRSQYERLFLEPGGRAPPISTLSQRFGNPTPLAVVAFTLVLTPVASCFLKMGKADASSITALVGPFYFLGGLALVISGVMEWILGNTFPFVVFITFGGFWFGLAILQDPEHNIVSAYANNGGSASPAYNSGLMFYHAYWAVVIFIFLITSLRTNLVFAWIFFTLTFAFIVLAAAYSNLADGNTDTGTKLIQVAGGFAFGTIVGSHYLMASLLFASVDMPFRLPVGDLSGFMQRRRP